MGIPRIVLLVVALLLPTLSLLPLGTLWLWEHGYIVYWAIATCVVVIGVYFLQRRLIVPLPAEAVAGDANEPGDPAWTPRQVEAWADVMRLAANVRAERITSRDAVLNLGLETIELVAKRLHPERSDPLLQFTVPEALAVIERASDDLRELHRRQLPARRPDHGGAADVALSLARRPAAGREGLRPVAHRAAAQPRLRRHAGAARALHAPDLRGGARAPGAAPGTRLRAGRWAAPRSTSTAATCASRPSSCVATSPSASRRDLARAEAREAEPIRILVAGQTGAGKSSLVNALANAVEAAVDVLPATARFTPYRLTREGLPTALIIDSPGLTGPGQSPELIEARTTATWCCGWCRRRGPRARSMPALLAAIREHFAAEPNRHRPPMLLILTHIDHAAPLQRMGTALRPERRHAPEGRGDPRCHAGREPGSSALPPTRSCRCAPTSRWRPTTSMRCGPRSCELMPEAQRARLLRTLEDIRGASAWACGLVAGGQCRPRPRGDVSDSEHQSMTQTSIKPTDENERTQARAKKREREDAAPRARNGEFADCAGFSDPGL